MNTIHLCSSKANRETKVYSFYLETKVDWYYDDYFISRALNISIMVYQNYLMENFNGYYFEMHRVGFDNEDDAKNALEWINTLLLANKLTS